MHGTLIGDQHQIYDPALPQDSLVLGIQGVLAVHELNSIHQRLQSSLGEKASRGELHHGVPRGYVVVEGMHLRKHPDRRVQQAIQRLFEKFQTCSSVSQLLSWLWEQNLQLPRSPVRGDGTKVEWVEANYRCLLDVLKNPKYAGIYVYPRYHQETKVLPCGTVQKTRRLSQPDEWQVELKDHHPAYITRQQYEANQQKIAMNAQRYTSSRGAVNRGSSLLAGLIVAEGVDFADRRFDDQAVVTMPVGSYKPNGFGLHDMHGNVAEWTLTDFGGGERTVKGGSFLDPPSRCRADARRGYPPWQNVHNTGFRIVVND